MEFITLFDLLSFDITKCQPLTLLLVYKYRKLEKNYLFYHSVTSLMITSNSFLR